MQIIGRTNGPLTIRKEEHIRVSERSEENLICYLEWYTRWGSNPQPSPPEGDTLSN